MAKFILGAAMALVLAGCGGSGDSPAPTPPTPPASLPAAPAPPPPVPTTLHIIGNSITYIPAAPGTEWDHSSGMAASSAATDYAHLVATGLGLEPVISNFASLERDPADPINTIDTTTPMADQIKAQTQGIDAHTIVVIELGDNAPQGGSPDFTTNYGKLLDAVTPNTKLVCVGTFWLDELVDLMIQAQCTAHHGTYVYIGDITGDPANRDLLDGPQYPTFAINHHPHDWSMAVIAKRVLAAVNAPN